MRVWWLVLGACSSRVSAPVTNPPATTTLTLSAEQSLHADAAPDYDRPFKAKPWDRHVTAALYLDRCNHGDRRACLIHAQVLPLDDKGESYRRVEANCRAGDQMSCRALPLDERRPRFPDAPGAISRRPNCQQYSSKDPCDAVGIREECLAGFPKACESIVFAHPRPGDFEKLFQSWPEQEVLGCAAGIEAECAMSVGFQKDEEELATLKFMCDLRPDDCDQLAMRYERLKDRPHQREMLEVACEYGQRPWRSCIELGEGYLNHRFEEPVPGRGQALIDWGCREIVPHTFRNVRDALPVCRRAKKPD